MGHGITSTDKFAFTGSRSNIWHALGNELPDGLTAVQAFDREGLGWETELAPVFAEYGGQRIALPDNRAHVRRDNGAILGLVSDGYKPIDNGDLAKFADSLIETGEAKVSTCGSLLGGKRVFVALELPKTIKLGPVDSVLPFILISNGHGGFASFNVYPSGIRPVCRNTIQASERDLGYGIRFHHTGDLDAKLKQARMVLGLASKEVEAFGEKLKALANTDLSAGQVKDFMELAFTATFGKAPDKDAEPEAHEKWVAKRKEMVADWTARMDNERQTLRGIQGTAWAAFNCYTEWSDHDRGGAWMDGRSRDHRVHSNLFGVSALSKRKVLKAALAFAAK